LLDRCLIPNCLNDIKIKKEEKIKRQCLVLCMGTIRQRGTVEKVVKYIIIAFISNVCNVKHNEKMLSPAKASRQNSNGLTLAH